MRQGLRSSALLSKATDSTIDCVYADAKANDKAATVAKPKTRGRGRKRKEVEGKIGGMETGSEHLEISEAPKSRIMGMKIEPGSVTEAADVGVGDNLKAVKRGRPKLGDAQLRTKKRKVESSQCNDADMVGEVPLDGEVEVLGRVLRSGTMTMGASAEMDGGVLGGKKNKSKVLNKKTLELKMNGTPRLRGRPKKILKARRGRPPKVQSKIGVLKGIGDEKETGGGSKKKGPRVKAEKISNAGKDTNIKELKRKKEKTGKLKLRRQSEQQLLREQITCMLKNAGWTVEYRPRKGKEYNDAVYVNPKGGSYWSVTKAYHVLKKEVEDGKADSNTVTSFSPIPEEVFSSLYRITEKRKERERKLEQEGEGGNNTENGDTKRKRKKNKTATENVSPSSGKVKLSSALKHGGKSLSKGIKRKLPHPPQKNISTNSYKEIPKLNRRKTQGRRRIALLARSSKKGPGSKGFVSCGGKLGLLSWMIDLGTVQPSEKVQYMDSMTRTLLNGKITRDGIHCGCCNKILSFSDFESHAGITSSQPLNNIYLESGISLYQCLRDSWTKQEECKHIGDQLVKVDSDDPNDDTCNMCGDGGDLICCDGCPSTFHQSCLNIESFPSGDWHCVYCSCKFCGTTGEHTRGMDANHAMSGSALHTCRLCEEKYHRLCVQGSDAVNLDSSCLTFCGKKCQELFEQLQALLGVKHNLEDGFSWTLIQRSEIGRDMSISDVPPRVECNSKLAVAFSIMDECFLPIVDHRSGIHMIQNVVYSCGSNFNRLNYSGFFTAILERGDEIISAASIRVHGNRLAEMPFIATRHIYRRQGMCRRLLNAIELALCSLKVEKLVIPAISELMETWRGAFGFKLLEESSKTEMRYMKVIVFPGTAMLQKPLIEHQVAKGNTFPSPVSKCIEFENEIQTGNKDAENPEEGCCSESDLSGPREIVVHNENSVNDVATAVVECGSQIPDASLLETLDTANEAVLLQNSTINEKCVGDFDISHDNQDSEACAIQVHEPDRQHATDGSYECENAFSGSVTVCPQETIVEQKSELCQQSSRGVENKCNASSNGCDDGSICDGKPLSAVDCRLNGEVTGVKHDDSQCGSAD